MVDHAHGSLASALHYTVAALRYRGYVEPSSGVPFGPLLVENTSTHQMGNPNFYKSRVFAGQPMAQLVDCGSGMTGPKASTYRIYISLLTSISTDGKGATTVQTTFVPMGQDISAGSADRIPCGSTGRFEQNFHDRISKTLGK